jgi:hypothetical protein
LFSSTKLEKKRAEQDLPGNEMGCWRGRGGRGQDVSKRKNDEIK